MPRALTEGVKSIPGLQHGFVLAGQVFLTCCRPARWQAERQEESWAVTGELRFHQPFSSPLHLATGEPSAGQQPGSPVLTLPRRLLLPLDVRQRDSLLGHSEVHKGGCGQCLQLEGGGDGFLDGRGSRERLHVHRVEVQDVAHCKDSTEPGSARGPQHASISLR